MRCPLRMKALDHPDTCDPECAWRMWNAKENIYACAVAANAMASADRAGWDVRMMTERKER